MQMLAEKLEGQYSRVILPGKEESPELFSLTQVCSSADMRQAIVQALCQ